jgi:hypothetical protein
MPKIAAHAVHLDGADAVVTLSFGSWLSERYVALTAAVTDHCHRVIAARAIAGN